MDKRIIEKFINKIKDIQKRIESEELTNEEVVDIISERIKLVDEILFLVEDMKEMDELFTFRKTLVDLRTLFITIDKIEKGTL